MSHPQWHREKFRLPVGTSAYRGQRVRVRDGRIIHAEYAAWATPVPPLESVSCGEWFAAETVMAEDDAERYVTCMTRAEESAPSKAAMQAAGRLMSWWVAAPDDPAFTRQAAAIIDEAMASERAAAALVAEHCDQLITEICAERCTHRLDERDSCSRNDEAIDALTAWRAATEAQP